MANPPQERKKEAEPPTPRSQAPLGSDKTFGLKPNYEPSQAEPGSDKTFGLKPNYEPLGLPAIQGQLHIPVSRFQDIENIIYLRPF